MTGTLQSDMQVITDKDRVQKIRNLIVSYDIHEIQNQFVIGVFG